MTRSRSRLFKPYTTIINSLARIYGSNEGLPQTQSYGRIPVPLNEQQVRFALSSSAVALQLNATGAGGTPMTVICWRMCESCVRVAGE
jgi:hypothetical protein